MDAPRTTLKSSELGAFGGVSRRQLLRGAAVTAGGSAVLRMSSATARASTQGSGAVHAHTVWARRAEATYEALQRYFHIRDGTGLYREFYPDLSATPCAALWPFSRVLVGTMTLAGVPREFIGGRRYGAAVADRLAALTRYGDRSAPHAGYRGTVAPPTGIVGDTYYDDNAWIGLALIQHHRTTRAPGSLAAARDVFAFVSPGGWDADRLAPYPGGNFWVQQGVGLGLTNHDRTTTATAPNGELGFRLAQADRTGARAYAHAGARMQEWVTRNLYNVDGSGLVYDKVGGDGQIDPTLWTYNQGALIAADVMRYRLGGETEHLFRAEALAARSLAFFSQADYLDHSPAFNAIHFRGLLQLHAVSASQPLKVAIIAAMSRYAEEVWNHHRTPENLFNFVTSPGAVSVLFQGAVLQIFATLAWHPRDYPNLA